MARIQEEITKKSRYLHPSDQNRRSLRVVYQYQNLLATSTRMWTIFSFVSDL